MSEETQVQTFDAQIAPISAPAITIRVTDAASNTEAGRMLLAFTDLRKRIGAYFKPLKEAAHRAHKAITERESAELAKLSPGEQHLRAEMGAYATKLEQTRREEQRRLEAEERARIETQRKELAAKAEADAAAARAEQERQRAAEQAAREAGDRKGAEEAEAKRKAAEAEEAQRRSVAEKIASAPIATPVVIVPKVAPAVVGVTSRTVWEFEVTDITKLPIQFLQVNESAIRKVVEASKGDTQIPGVRVWSRQAVAAGRL